MAVAVDNSASVVETVANSGTAVATAGITVSASATLAIAFLELSRDGGNDDSTISEGTITFGGSAMTFLTGSKKQAGTDATRAGRIEMYYLASPPTGASKTANWSPTYTGPTLQLCTTLVIVTFTGTDTTTIFGTPVLDNDAAGGSTRTVTDTLAAGDMFVGIACNGSASPTMVTGTSIAAPTGTGNSGSHFVRVAQNTGSGSVSLAFSMAADLNAISAVKILQAGGGGGGSPVKPGLTSLQAVRRAAFY